MRVFTCKRLEAASKTLAKSRGGVWLSNELTKPEAAEIIRRYVNYKAVTIRRYSTGKMYDYRTGAIGSHPKCGSIDVNARIVHHQSPNQMGVPWKRITRAEAAKILRGVLA